MRAIAKRPKVPAGAAGGRSTWRQGTGPGGALTVPIAAIALMVLLAMAGGAAGAAQGAAGAAGDDDTVGRDQLPAVVAVPVAGPLTALSGSGQSLTCVQTPVAMDAAGRTGVLAPQVGVTVIRGSAAPSPSLTWVVVPAGQAGGDGRVAVTVCTPTR